MRTLNEQTLGSEAQTSREKRVSSGTPSAARGQELAILRYLVESY